jgi:hypothetical protein
VADVTHNVSGEIGGGSENAAGDQVALDFAKPDFDLIKPGGVGGSEMHLQSRMLGQESSNGFGFMGREIVHDDVNLLCSRVPTMIAGLYQNSMLHCTSIRQELPGDAERYPARIVSPGADSGGIETLLATLAPSHRTASLPTLAYSIRGPF